MAIDLPTHQALRGIGALRALVEAVKSASDSDELDWIEWKSTLDLTTKAGCFHVARAILGLANRIPEKAARSCEGLGYVVVGAEPGRVEGVASVDPARLDTTVELYVGSSGPSWSPIYVPVDGRDVLVVTVEAPNPGDPIFLLRREFDTARSGAVFVRKNGRTVPADANDLDALQQRLLARRPTGSLELDVLGQLPLGWVDAEAAMETIETWLSQQTASMIEAARNLDEARRHPISPAQGMFSPFAGGVPTFSAAASLFQPDTRTLSEFIDEVDAWAQRVRGQALQALPQRLAEARIALVTIRIRNTSDTYLNDLQVVVHIEGDDISPGDDRQDSIDVPAHRSPPRTFGQAIAPDFGMSGILGLADVRMPSLPGPPKRLWVEEGSVLITWDVGDLRQRSAEESSPIPLLVRTCPEQGAFRAAWRATSPSVPGVTEGEVSLPVAAEPIRPGAVFRDFAPAED